MGRYFGVEDFEIFNSDVVRTNGNDIAAKRRIVKNKLLEINEDIKGTMGVKDLHNHWKPEHIISWLTPCEYNKGKVDWIGLRFGRNKDKIDALNFGIGKDEMLGFQKYNCFQINLCRTGVEMGMFHSVPKDGVDRMYCHQMIRSGDEKFRKDLVKAVDKIVGYGFVWSVGNDFESDSFSFDDVECSDGCSVGDKFIDWYDRCDRDGMYSSVLYHFSRFDDRIGSKDLIEVEFLKIVERLGDLYKVMSWKVKGI